jgi:preprotein translocase subunit SecE
MEKLRVFFRGYSDELLHKVQWPKFEELQDSTLVVLVASLILAIVIALMDTLFRVSLQFFYELF